MNYFSKHIAKYQEGGQISNEQLDQLVDVFLQRPDLFALASEQTIGEDGPINNEIVDRVTHMTDEQKIQLKDNIKSDEQFCNILVQLFPAVQELANSEPQTMKNGGKTEYLKTLKNGGVGAVTIEKTPKAAAKSAKANAVRMPDRGATIKRYEGAAVDVNGGQHLYMDEDVNGNNTAYTDVYIPSPGDTLVTQNVVTKYGNVPYTTSNKIGDERYDKIMARARKSPYLNGILDAVRKMLK